MRRRNNPERNSTIDASVTKYYDELTDQWRDFINNDKPTTTHDLSLAQLDAVRRARLLIKELDEDTTLPHDVRWPVLWTKNLVYINWEISFKTPNRLEGVVCLFA